MSGPLFELLYECTVRFNVAGGNGTGFFVAPGLILTCAHVIEAAGGNLRKIKAHYNSQELVVESIKVREKPYPDLALIRVDLSGHPCVFLDSMVTPGDTLFTYGHTTTYPGGVSTTVSYEGPARLSDQQWFLKFKNGQILSGYSGSPLINTKTWGVCGIVKSTRDKFTDLGGGGIPTAVVLTELPELAQLQAMFHNWDSRWLDTRKQQIQLGAQKEPALPIKIISVQLADIPIPSATYEIESEKFEPKILAEGLYRPMSLDWFAQDQIAVCDGRLHLVTPDGDIRETSAVSGHVSVHFEKQLVALCSSDLSILDLRSGEVLKSVVIDHHASSYQVEWSPNGAYLAVGATNVLKIFTSDLDPISSYFLGGKYGAKAVTWSSDGSVLYAGIGNGELWSLKEPFDNPAVVTKGSSSVLALRSSQIDNRIACLWKDGTFEVRSEALVLASMVISTTETWIASDPKIAWCLDHKVLACTTGLSHNLIFWHYDLGTAVSTRFERELAVLDVDPSDSNLILGMDDQNGKDAELRLIQLPKVLSVFQQENLVHKTKRPEPHLLEANSWNLLIDWVEDKRKSVEPSFALKLEIPTLISHLNQYEERIRNMDAEEAILRSLKRQMKTAREHADSILDDLLWVSQQMKERGYSDHDISVVCDRATSFGVNSILGRLHIDGFPQIESLTKFVAFTLGYEQGDLLSLGFDTSDGRGNKAEVPTDFLSEIEDLASIGESLGEKYGASTVKEKIKVACRFFHEFDSAFGYNEQIELWTRFVLPLALIRYPREKLIIHPSEVERFGLAK